jgi:hypothetical protein
MSKQAMNRFTWESGRSWLPDPVRRAG